MQITQYIVEHTKCVIFDTFYPISCDCITIESVILYAYKQALCGRPPIDKGCADT